MMEVVIATLFEPPTLPAILDSCEKQGVKAHVIKGMPVNHAWNEGLRRCSSRYVAILNDDLAIDPHDSWVEKIIKHHESGKAWVGPRVFGERVYRDGGLPEHYGHAFSLDTEVGGKLYTPHQLRVYYADNFFFANYGIGHGWCVATDVEVRIGEDCGLPGRGGWTGHVHYADIEKVLGVKHEVMAAEDHKYWEQLVMRGEVVQ